MARAIILPIAPGKADGNAPGWFGGSAGGFSANEAGTGGWDLTFPVVFVGTGVPNGLDQDSITVTVLVGDTGATIQNNVWTALNNLATAKGYAITRSQVFFYGLSKGL